MFKKILLALAAIIVIFLIVAAIQPAEFSISRSVSINASPAKVYGIASNFQNWSKWNPWAAQDPSMKTTFEGPQSGSGAILSWSGNDKVGEGRMTITDAKPNESVSIKLEFIKPWTTTNQVDYAIKAESEGCSFSWTMSGKHQFIGKAISLLMNMDKMVGADFERGLASLKALAETPDPTPTPAAKKKK